MLAQYKNHPARFVKEVLQDAGKPYDKQEAILDALARYSPVSVVAANSSGKDWAAARAVLWWLHTRPHAKAVVTGPTARQVKEILWHELGVALAAANGRLPGKLTADKYVIDDDRFAIAFCSNSQHNLQGFHSPNLLVVVTEAQGVKQPYFEALKRLNPKKTLLLGNPLSHEGELYESFHSKSALYHRIAISALDSPNFRRKRFHIPGLVNPEDVERRRRDWGEDSPLYIASVLGRFPDALEDSLTTRHHVDRAVARWRGDPVPLPSPSDMAASLSVIPAQAGTQNASLPSAGEAGRGPSPSVMAASPSVIPAQAGTSQPSPLPAPAVDRDYLNHPYRMGVDVARFGDAESVICIRRGQRVEHLIPLKRGLDTMQVADEVKAWADALRVPAVFVDENGVGGGVVDRLGVLGVPVIGVEAGGKAKRPSQFVDMRAEIFWEIARLLREDAIDIPDDAVLAGQLLALRYDISSTGRIRLESKTSLRKRGVKSPDRADALALAFMEPPSLQIYV